MGSDLASCKIHDTDKPEACKNFPVNARNLEDYPECKGFWFDDEGVRHGECLRCGKCCTHPYITPPGYSEKYRDTPCPYLVPADE
jgi:Fe-S-cluster containining protein